MWATIWLVVLITILVLLNCIFIFTQPRINQAALEEVYYSAEVSNVSAAYCVYHLQCIGFSAEDARIAVDSAKVDWDQEAIDCAIDVLKWQPELDQESLIEWLEYVGFTESQIARAIKLAFEGR